MKRKEVLLLVVVLVGLVVAHAASAPRASSKKNVPPAEMKSKAWLEEVVRHLYRWYLDERAIDRVIQSGDVIFWIREIKPKLDEGDRSRFGEVIMPQFLIAVKAKQADYTIPEFNVTVKNETFRITQVERLDARPVKPKDATEVRVAYSELRDELFRTRNRASFPERDLLDRMEAALRAEVAEDIGHSKRLAPQETQVVYLAPLSAVANETWVFWENGRTLIRFASDIDLANPAVWEHEKLAAHLFHLDKNVVVTLDEVAGSNAFLTRDEASRVLFNCMILGEREELSVRR
jgi:hypothetical protein